MDNIILQGMVLIMEMYNKGERTMPSSGLQISALINNKLIDRTWQEKRPGRNSGYVLSEKGRKFVQHVFECGNEFIEENQSND